MEGSLHIVSLALGGCLKGEPVRYGITEDTGGHITYILGEMRALAKRDDVSCAEIITRRFDAPELGTEHAETVEQLDEKLVIRRIDSGNRDYLAKDALRADRAAFTEALIEDLSARDRLPDLIHAHFSDAADVAARVEDALGIPFVYTAHSLGADKRAAMACPGAAMEARLAEEDAAIARCAAIIGSSRDECERQVMAYPSARPGKIQRLIPGAPVHACEPMTSEALRLVEPFLRDATRPMVLAIARPVEKKNLVTLVEAFAGSDYLREHCNLVLIAGLRNDLTPPEPEQAQVLQNLVAAIDRHDLYGQVAYPKSHTQRQIDGLYALAARTGGVFVNPALIEPYGLTLVEAASHGLPVVATMHGGPQDIVETLQHGTLVDPRDPIAIAEAARDILANRRTWNRLSANALSNVPQMSWDAYAAGLVRIAKGIVHRPAAPARDTAPERLLVSDLDNTLTGCAAGAARFSRFLERRTDFGFAIATGRSIVEARRLVRDWNLPEPLAWITSTGSEIYLDDGGTLRLDAEYARFIGEGWDGDSVTAALAGCEPLKPQPCYEQRANKRSYFCEGEEGRALAETMLAEAGIAARVILSHGHLLDVLPTRAGKGAAMRHIARKLGLRDEQVFAAGDSGNDADMLTACENAILVGNHDTEVAGIARQSNVYVSRRSHGGGTLEGLVVQDLAARRLFRQTARLVAEGHGVSKGLQQGSGQ